MISVLNICMKKNLNNISISSIFIMAMRFIMKILIEVISRMMASKKKRF